MCFPIIIIFKTPKYQIYDINIYLITRSYAAHSRKCVYHKSHESQATDVSRVISSSVVASPLRILQPSPSKQITAYRLKFVLALDGKQKGNNKHIK